MAAGEGEILDLDLVPSGKAPPCTHTACGGKAPTCTPCASGGEADSEARCPRHSEAPPGGASEMPETPEIPETGWAAGRIVTMEMLEDEGYRRAIDGVAKPIFQQGLFLGERRIRSERMLKFLLVANEFEKFGKPEVPPLEPGQEPGRQEFLAKLNAIYAEDADLRRAYQEEVVRNCDRRHAERMAELRRKHHTPYGGEDEAPLGGKAESDQLSVNSDQLSVNSNQLSEVDPLSAHGKAPLGEKAEMGESEIPELAGEFVSQGTGGEWVSAEEKVRKAEGRDRSPTARRGPQRAREEILILILIMILINPARLCPAVPLPAWLRPAPTPPPAARLCHARAGKPLNKTRVRVRSRVRRKVVSRARGIAARGIFLLVILINSRRLRPAPNPPPAGQTPLIIRVFSR